MSDKQMREAFDAWYDAIPDPTHVMKSDLAWRAWQAAQAAVTDAAAPPQAVLDALRFYANGHHYNIDEDQQQFDTVSGEPQNWLHSEREDDCTMIEDGSIAKAALLGKLGGFEEPVPVIEGEVFAAPQPPHESDYEARKARYAVALAMHDVWFAREYPGAAAALATTRAGVDVRHDHAVSRATWIGALDCLAPIGPLSADSRAVVDAAQCHVGGFVARDPVTPEPKPSPAPADLLPQDRKWVIGKAIGLAAAYRNCEPHEAPKIMNEFTDYMRAALVDAATSPAPDEQKPNDEYEVDKGTHIDRVPFYNPECAPGEQKSLPEPDSACDPADICAGCRCKYNWHLRQEQPSARGLSDEPLCSNNLPWLRNGSGNFEWWSLKGYEARKDAAGNWVLTHYGEEQYRHEFLQVVMAHAERAILAASATQGDSNAE